MFKLWTCCRVHPMEPRAAGKLSPTFSSSSNLKLLGVLSTSGPDGWKMRLPFHLGFQFPIIQCILSSVHQQTPVHWPCLSVNQLQTWDLKEHRVVICEGVCLVICRESSNLLQYPVSKVGMPKYGRGTEGRSIHLRKRNFSCLLPTSFPV